MVWPPTEGEAPRRCVAHQPMAAAASTQAAATAAIFQCGARAGGAGAGAAAAVFPLFAESESRLSRFRSVFRSAMLW